MKTITRIISLFMVALILTTSVPFTPVSAVDVGTENYTLNMEKTYADSSLAESSAVGGMSFFGSAEFDGCYGNQLSGVAREIYDSLVKNYVTDKITGEYTHTFETPFTFDAEISGGSIVMNDELEEIDIEIGYAVQAAMDAFLYDHPEVFWLRIIGSSYGVSASGNDVSGYTGIIDDITIIPTEIYSGASSKLSQYESAVDSVIDAITVTESRYDTLKNIHDYICNNAWYNLVSEQRVHSSEPFFIGDGGVVCEGYAKTFKILCDRLEIPCVLVSGDAGGAHMWNYVQMDDGKWYLVDATWDDQESKIYDTYFLVDANTIGFDGVAINEERIERNDFSGTGIFTFTYPVLSSTIYTVHIHEWESDYTVDVEPTCTESGSMSIHCKTCVETKSVTEIAADHTDENADGYCDVCRELISPDILPDDILEPFAGGSGTVADPYLISDKAHLDNIRNDLDAHYLMISDIVFSESDFSVGGEFYNDGDGWIPIGQCSSRIFNGTLDGNGFSIKNLTISATEANGKYYGLFSQSYGVIKNLSVEDACISVNNTIETHPYVGGIAGELGCYNLMDGTPIRSSIENCSFSGQIQVSNEDYLNGVGGIVGSNWLECTIRDCHNYGLIIGELDVGGICGNNLGIISCCSNMGEVTIVDTDSSFTKFSGGICASNSGDIEYCYNVGDVSDYANYGYCGGIAGENRMLISDCYNTATNSGSSVGGIIGTSVYGVTQRCYNAGTLTGSIRSGGITSDIYSGSIEKCYYLQGPTGLGYSISSSALQNKNLLSYLDFNDVWEFVEGNIYKYPTLKKNSQYILSDSDFQNGSGTEDDPYLIASSDQLNNVRYYLNSYFKLVRDIVFKDANFVQNGEFYNEGSFWEPIGDFTNNFTGNFDGNGYAIKNIVSKKGGIFDYITYAVIKNLTICDANYEFDIGTENTIYFGTVANVMNNSTIENCHNESNINLDSTNRLYVGGIVGTTGNNRSNIIGCSNKGNLFGKSVGGIVSIGNNVSINNCYNTGTINAYSELQYGANAGGIAALARGAIEDCYNTGNIELVFANSLANYLYSQYCGGIVGDGYNTYVNNCYNTGNIFCEVVDSTIYSGGVVGMTSDGAISKCFNTGNLSSIGSSEPHGSVDHIKVGGIVGETRGSSTVNNCYNNGNVESIAITTDAVMVAFAGGVAGNTSDGKTKIYDCYNTGDVNSKHTLSVEKDGSALAGGVSGAVMNFSSVNKCYNIGKVTASSTYGNAKYGGISGQGKTGTINSCYYLDVVSVGIGDNNGTTIRGTFEDFSTQEFFKDFDFNNIWTINETEGYKFPELLSCTMNTCQTGGPHIFIVDKEIAPTCTEPGLTEGKHCLVCDLILIKQETTFTKGHSYGSYKTIKNSTCTAEGLKQRSCSVCNDIDNAIISKLRHSYSSSYTVDKKATCTTEGSKSKHCTRSGCTATTSVTKISKLAHTNKTTTAKATISKNGKIITKCTACGTVSKTTTIYYPKTIKLSSTSYTYNGKSKTPTVTVKDSKGKTLKKGTEYIVAYSKGRKSIGKYTVTVTFKGNYSGTKKITFEIVPAKVTLSKLTVGSKALTATWKTVSGATGYEVQYSTSKKFTSKTTRTVKIKSSKTKKTTIKKLTKGKKYYVRIRAYKTVSKKPVYGAWSSVKNIKVK